MSEREELVKSLHELYNQLQADGWQYYSLRGNGLHTISRAIACLSSQEDVRDGVLEEAAQECKILIDDLADSRSIYDATALVHIQTVQANIRAMKSKPAEECEHVWGMRQTAPDWAKDAGRIFDVCAKCGQTKDAPQPTQEAPSLVEEWRSRLKIASGTRLLRVDGNDLEELLDAVESYIDRRLAERA